MTTIMIKMKIKIVRCCSWRREGWWDWWTWKRARAWASLDPPLSLRFLMKLASFFSFVTRSTFIPIRLKSLSTSIFAEKQRYDPKPTSSDRFWWSWEFWVLVLRLMPPFDLNRDVVYEMKAYIHIYIYIFFFFFLWEFKCCCWCCKIDVPKFWRKIVSVALKNWFLLRHVLRQWCALRCVGWCTVVCVEVCTGVHGLLLWGAWVAAVLYQKVEHVVGMVRGS